MLRLKREQRDFWEDLLPPEALRLNPELEAVDTLLDDEAFLAPFRKRFSAKRGRYTIPMETYLRLMYLKRRYQMGYESLMTEVNDSVSWRRFCRISLSDPVPDASTLIKLTNGPCQGLELEVHQEVVRALRERKVPRNPHLGFLRGRKARTDTTVVEANIHYPTDAGLLADGVRTVTRTVKRIQALGASAEVEFRDVRRSVRRRLQHLAKGLKKEGTDRKSLRNTLTKEVLAITQRMVLQAKEVAAAAKPWLGSLRHRPGRGQEDRLWCRGKRLVGQLEGWLEGTERVVEQTTRVLAGEVHIPDRLVSLFDPEARPIRKGKLRAPTEFGYKVVVTDDDRGFVTDYQVLQGNPPDRDQLVPAIERHSALVGEVPWEVAGDRGMGSLANEAALQAMGVVHCSLPKSGSRTSAERDKEKRSWFRRLQRFRAGGEARISLLKRKYGWRRSLQRGSDRVTSWVGWGAIAHNLTRYGRMQVARVGQQS